MHLKCNGLLCHSQSNKNNSSGDFVQSYQAYVGWRGTGQYLAGYLPHPPHTPSGLLYGRHSVLSICFMLSKASGANEPCTFCKVSHSVLSKDSRTCPHSQHTTIEKLNLTAESATETNPRLTVKCGQMWSEKVQNENNKLEKFYCTVFFHEDKTTCSNVLH